MRPVEPRYVPAAPKGRVSPVPPAIRSHPEHAAPMAPADYGHASSRRMMVGLTWVAFGVLVAAGVVVAAFLFRPAFDTASVAPAEPVASAAAVESLPPPEPQPVPAVPDQAAAEPPATAVPAAAAPAAAALAGVGVVRLRVGPEFPADRQAAILAALKGAGLGSVQVEPLPFKVATSRVGYYRPADVAAAEALARLITPVVGEGEVGVRDYSQLLDDADPGRLDLWVGG